MGSEDKERAVGKLQTLRKNGMQTPATACASPWGTPCSPAHESDRPTCTPVLDGPEAGIGLGIHDREDLLIRQDVEQQWSCSFSDPLHELTCELHPSARVPWTAQDDGPCGRRHQTSVSGDRSAFEECPELIFAQTRPRLPHDLSQDDPAAPRELQIVAVTGRRLVTDPPLIGEDEPRISYLPRPSSVDDVRKDHQGQIGPRTVMRDIRRYRVDHVLDRLSQGDTERIAPFTGVRVNPVEQLDDFPSPPLDISR